ncbi:penicillin-binding protein 2, partial [Candidatus Thioglobus sp.]|nr:penicillin-binding protein 2 [Candidatus Thioglobus sp.]
MSLKLKASNNSEFTIIEKSIRGNILDRNNNLLAINLIHKKINLDPMILQDEYIDLLAEALNIPTDEFREKISKKRENKRKYFIVKEKLRVNDPILNNIAKLKNKRINICLKELKLPSNNLADKVKLLVGLKLAVKEKIEEEKCTRQSIAGVAIESS